jgi:hypothetical protein
MQPLVVRTSPENQKNYKDLIIFRLYFLNLRVYNIVVQLERERKLPAMLTKTPLLLASLDAQAILVDAYAKAKLAADKAAKRVAALREQAIAYGLNTLEGTDVTLTMTKQMRQRLNVGRARSFLTTKQLCECTDVSEVIVVNVVPR